MESPGEYLKRERELRRVPLSKIFEATRVPMKTLEALEADDYETLPHPAFVKGFIKTYCKALGLDETDAVLRYEMYIREKAAEAEEKGGRPHVPPRKRPIGPRVTEVRFAEAKKLPKGLRVAIPVVAGILIIIAAWSLSGRKETPPAPEITEAPGEAPAETPGPEQAVKSDTAQQAAPVAPVQAAPPEPHPVALAPRPSAEKALPAMAAPVPKAEAPAPAPKAEAPKAEPQSVKPAQKIEPPKEAAVVAAPAVSLDGQTLTATAKEPVWIKIRIDGAAEATEVLLKGGERHTWKAADNFSVMVGNAGGVTLTYNGKEIQRLGAPGEVVSLLLSKGATQRLTPRRIEPRAEPKAETAQEPAPEPKPGFTPLTGPFDVQPQPARPPVEEERR